MKLRMIRHCFPTSFYKLNLDDIYTDLQSILSMLECCIYSVPFRFIQELSHIGAG